MTQARITATLATACLLVGCSATAQQVPRPESQEEYNVGQGGHRSLHCARQAGRMLDGKERETDAP